VSEGSNSEKCVPKISSRTDRTPSNNKPLTHLLTHSLTFEAYIWYYDRNTLIPAPTTSDRKGAGGWRPGLHTNIDQSLEAWPVY
jgi:hypothetical protein